MVVIGSSWLVLVVTGSWWSIVLGSVTCFSGDQRRGSLTVGPGGLCAGCGGISGGLCAGSGGISGGLISWWIGDA